MQESKQVGRCHLYETSHCRGWEKARDREQDERSRDAARKEGALQCEKERHRWGERAAEHHAQADGSQQAGGGHRRRREDNERAEPCGTCGEQPGHPKRSCARKQGNEPHTRKKRGQEMPKLSEETMEYCAPLQGNSIGRRQSAVSGKEATAREACPYAKGADIEHDNARAAQDAIEWQHQAHRRQAQDERACPDGAGCGESGGDGDKCAWKAVK